MSVTSLLLHGRSPYENGYITYGDYKEWESLLSYIRGVNQSWQDQIVWGQYSEWYNKAQCKYFLDVVGGTWDIDYSLTPFRVKTTGK